MYVCIYNMRKYTTFFKTKHIASNTNYFLGRSMPTIDLRGNGWHISEMQIFHPPRAVSVHFSSMTKSRQRKIMCLNNSVSCVQCLSHSVIANSVKIIEHQQKMDLLHNKKGRCSQTSFTKCHSSLYQRYETPTKDLLHNKKRQMLMNVSHILSLQTM